MWEGDEEEKARSTAAAALVGLPRVEGRKREEDEDEGIGTIVLLLLRGLLRGEPPLLGGKYARTTFCC